MKIKAGKTQAIKFFLTGLVLTLLFVCASIFIYGPTNTARAAINDEINFQGKLTNTNGTNVTDGSYSVVFSIYSVATGGSAIWTETDSVTTSSGIFNVDLGAVTTLPGSVNFDSASLYLGIKVGSDPEMTPRIQLTSVPQAFQANNADNLGGVAASGYAQLGATQSFTGVNTFANTTKIQPTTNVTSVDILQNSSGSFGQDVFDVQGSGGSSNFIQVTSTAANQGAVTIASLGSNNLSLNSGSNTISVGATTVQGTGALAVEGASGSNLTIGSNAVAGLIQIGGTGTTGTITLGQWTGTTGTQTISIGSSVGAGGTQDINIGNSGAGTSTINIGSTAAGATTIQSAGGLAVMTIPTGGTNLLCYNSSGNIVSTCSALSGGAYIENQTTVQAANLYVQAATSGTVAGVLEAYNGGSGDILDLRNGTGGLVGSVGSTGNVLLQASTNSINAFQVQNAGGSDLLDVNTANTVNLISNGVFVTNTSGWSAKNGATLTQSTSQTWQGNNSMKVATTTSANDGAYYSYTLSPNTTYTFSLWAEVSSSSISDVNIGRQEVSGTDIDCLTGQTVSTSWAQYSCTFTTGGTITNSNLYIKKTGGTAQTFYISGVQLQQGSLATGYNANNPALTVGDDASVGNLYGYTIFSDNFESGNTLQWTAHPNDGVTSVQSGIVHSGSYALELNYPGGNASGLYETINNTSNTTYLRAWVYVASQTTATADLLRLFNGNNGAPTAWDIQRTTSNHICVYYESTAVQDCGGSFTLGTWNEVEVQITTGSSPVTNLWLNGGLIFNSTSISNGTVDPEFIEPDQNLDTLTYYVDDVAVTTVRDTNSSSLNVSDTLSVQGYTDLNNNVLIQSNTSDALQVMDTYAHPNFSVDTIDSLVTINSKSTVIQPGPTLDTTTALRVINSAGTNTVIDVDTSDGYVGIGTAAPGAELNISGANLQPATVSSGSGTAAANSITVLGAAGGITSATTGVTGGKGSAISLQGGTGGNATGASGSNVGGAGGGITIAAGTGGNVTSATGTAGSGGKLLLEGGAIGTGGATAGSSGSVVVQSNGTNSTTAFQVQGSAGASSTLLNGDTTNMRLGVDVTYATMVSPTISNSSTATTGGTLAQNTTYYYEITAVDANGGETTPSAQRTQATGNTTATNTITLTWAAIPGAAGYHIYRSTTSGVFTSVGYYSTLGTVSSNLTYTDTNGSLNNTTASPPSTATAYVATNVANTNNLELSVGGNGTPTGQVYVSGTVPTAPVGSARLSSGVGSFVVEGRYAYVLSGNTLQVIDVSNSASPTILGSAATTSNPDSVYVSGHYAYVVGWSFSTGLGFLQTIDVSNPSSPSSISSVTIGYESTGIYVSGHYAYVVNEGANTLQIIDISNPANPVTAGSISTGAGTSPTSVYVQGRYAYVTNNGNDTLGVFDVSNPASPVSVGSASTGVGTPDSVYVQGRYAYVTTKVSLNALLIFDVSNPASPVEVGSNSTNLSYPYSVSVQGRYAYVVSSANSTMQVIDVSNPVNPVNVGGVTTGGTPQSLIVSGRYAYVGDTASPDALQIYDLGGEYAQQLQTGGLETGTLQVDTDASIAGDTTIQGGLNVGQSIQTTGNLGVGGNTVLQGNLSIAGTVQGGISLSGLVTPSAPTVAPQGTTGSTGYSYAVVAVSASGGVTPVSPSGSTSSGNASLGIINFNQVSWSPVAGATSYQVYRTASSGSPATLGYIGTTGSTSFIDNNVAASGTSAPTIDTTARSLDDLTLAAMASPSGLTLGQTSGGSLTTLATYKYKITAIDSAGGETTPSTEQSITLTGSNATITLYWTAVPGASGYKIYRTAANGATNTEVYLTTVLSDYSSASPYVDNGSITAGTATPPGTNDAVVSTNTSNADLQLVVGGNGTPTGQVYVSGTAPQFVGSLGGTISAPYGVALSGRYAYVGNGSLSVVDVSNPSDPALIGNVTTGNAGKRAVFVSGSYLYDVGANGSGALEIYSISNPQSPTLVGTTSAGMSSGDDGWSLYVQGRYAYVVNTSNNELAIYDVSNPASPTLVSLVTSSNINAPTGVFVQGNYAYITAIGSGQGLVVYNISNPTNPTYVGGISTDLNNPDGLYVQGRYAYIASYGNHDLTIVDVSNPASPTIAGFTSTNLSGPSDVVVEGRYAYVLDSTNNKLVVFDVSNPTSPTYVAENSDTNLTQPSTLAINGRYAFVSNIGAGGKLDDYDLGGEYAQELQAGGAEVGTLQVDSNANINGDTNIQGGLSVGSSIQAAENLGIGGGANIMGSTVLSGGNNQLSTPGAPTVTPTGTTGGTHYSYAVSAVNAYGGSTPASTATQTTSGNATLTTGNYNAVSWTSVSGATSYNIYRTASSGTPSTTGLIGTTSSTSFNDTGIVGSGNSAPTINSTGQLTVEGSTLLQTTTNSSTALQIQNASGQAVLTQSTSNDSLTINQGSLNVNGLSNPATPSLSTSTSAGSLPDTTTYYYLVSAIGAAGETQAIASSPASVTTTGASHNENTLSWSAVTDATSYNVYRSTNDTTWYYNNVSTTSMIDNGTTYTWSTGGSPDQSNNPADAINLQGGGGIINWASGSAISLYQTTGNTLEIDASNGAVGIQTGGLIYQDSANSYAEEFSVTNGGQALFQNAVNSSAAFQVQNAGGQNLLQVNTSLGNVIVNGDNTGALEPWSTNANPIGYNGSSGTIPLETWGSTVTANGYAYIVGGFTGSTASSTVYYSKLNTNGSTGTWSTTTALPVGLATSMVVVANGYIYSIGGENNTPSAVSTVYYAKLNSNGTIGSWNTDPNALGYGSIYGTSNEAEGSAVVANGYVYVLGGYNNVSGAQGYIFYAPLNADGTTGTWTANTNAEPSNLDYTGSAVANGYIYLLGGYNGVSNKSTVYYATLNASNGSIGTWTNDTADPIGYNGTSGTTTLAGLTSVVANGYIYAMGGITSGTTSSSAVYYAPLNANGSVGNWTTNSYPLGNNGSSGTIALDSGGSFVANGYVYYIGGESNNTLQSAIYYASTQRLQVGGTLDLVGLSSGSNLVNPGGTGGSGSTGGSLIAGDGTFVGNLQVQGEATFDQGLAVNGPLTDNSSTLLQDATNSTTAFQVQNASGQAVLTQDTTYDSLTINQGGLNVNGLSNPATPTLSTSTSAGSLPDTTTYYYLVSAVGAAGETQAIAPSPASVTTTGASHNENTITWTAVTDATSYNVYRSTNDSTWYVNNVSSTSMIDNGTTYTWTTGGGPALYSNSTDYVSLQGGGGIDWGSYGAIYDDSTDSTLVIGSSGGGSAIINQASAFSLEDPDNSYETEFQIQDDGQAYFENAVNSYNAFQIQSTTASVLNVDTVDGIVTLQNTLSDATAGSNLITTTNFTNVAWTGTGWTTTATTAAHNTGNTDALSTSQFATIPGATYSVTFTVTGNPTSTESITPSFSGGSMSPIYGNASAITETIAAQNTGSSLAFIPTTNWNGTISAVSVVQIYSSNSALQINNSSGADELEVRAASNSNSFVGLYSGRSNTTGYYNTAFGTQDLEENTTGYFNTALGAQAMLVNSTGNNNVAVGSGALTDNVNGSGNDADGYFSLGSNVTGNDNTGLGEQALTLNTIGNYNTSVGYLSGYTSNSAYANVSGSNNTFIGFYSGPGSATQLQNASAIGTNSVVSESNAMVLGCVSGVNGCTTTTEVGIDNASPAYALDVNGNVNADSGYGYLINGNNINSAGTLSNVAYLNGTGPQIFTGNNKFTGTVLDEDATNSTTAFQIQGSAGATAALLTGDTTNLRVGVDVTYAAMSSPAPTAAIPTQSATPTVTPKGTTGAASYGYIIIATGITAAPFGSSAASVAGTTATGNATLSNVNYNALSWTAYSNATGYYVYRSTGGGTQGYIGYTTTNSFNDTGLGATGSVPTVGGGLTASSQYYYKVTAIDSTGGETTPGTEVNATTGTVNTTDSITLYWTKVPGAIGYKIYRTAAGGSGGTEHYLTSIPGPASGTTVSFTDSGTIATSTAYSVPGTNTAYTATNVTNTNNLELSIGGNGTPTGQLYVSGTVPTAAVGTVNTGTLANSVYTQGSYSYVVNETSATLQIFDVSNPASPVLIGSANTGTAPVSVYVQGRYAYVVNGTSATLQIFDVSNPSSPVLVGSATTGTGPASVYVSGRYAYVVNTTSPALQIFDVSNPSSPVSVGSVATDAGPKSVYVQGRYAYVVNFNGIAALQIFDVSNPSSPVMVGSVSVAGSEFYSVYVQGRYAYVANYALGTLQIYDVSNPASPVMVGSVATGSDPKSVYVQGRYAYVANWNTGSLQTIDVSNPANPVSVGSVTTGNSPESVYVQGRYAYVVNGNSSTLQIFDLGGEYTQQLQAGGAEVGTLQVDTNATVSGNASIQGALSVGAGLQIAGPVGVNGSLNLTANALSSPTAPTLANSTGLATICGGNYLTNTTTYYYEVAAISGSSITNAVASSPTSVTTGTSTCDTLTWTAVTGATGYIVYRSTNGTTWDSNNVNNSTLGVVDNGTTYTWTNAASPLTITNNGGDLTVQGDSLFENVANSTTAFQIQNAASTELLNADTTNMRISIGSIGTPAGQLYVGGQISSAAYQTDTLSGSGAQSIISAGKLIYVSDYSLGEFSIYDNSNPAAPITISTTDENGTNTSGKAEAMALAGHYLYTVEYNTTPLMNVWDVSNPYAPVHVGSVSLGFNAGGIAIDGNTAYIATTGGVEVFNISNPLNPVGVTNITANIVIGTVDSVTAYGRYIYAADDGVGGSNDSFVKVIDTTTNTVVGSYELSGGTSGSFGAACDGDTIGQNQIYVQGQWIYAANTCHDVIDVFKLDTAGPANGATATTAPTYSVSTGSGIGPNALIAQGRYLYATLANSTTGATPTLATYDISQIGSSAPTQVGTTALNGIGISLATDGRYAYVATWTGNSWQTFDLGGEYAQQLEAGGIEAGTLNVDNDATISGNTSIMGSLQVAQNLQVTGNIGASGNVLLQDSTNSTTAFQIQGSAGATAALLTGDTTNMRLGVDVTYASMSSPAPTAAVPTQSATPTITPKGTTGGTSYGYIIIATGISAAPFGSSAASVAGTTSTGNATLSNVNYNALSWTAYSNATGYYVYRSTGGGTQGYIGYTTTNSFNDTGLGATGSVPTVGGGLTASSKYYYKVTAIDSTGGETTPGTEVNATTGASANTTQTITLYWTKVTGAIGYKIYRTAAAGGSGTETYLTSIPGPESGTTVSFTDSGTIATSTAYSVPSTNTAVAATNVTNTNNLELSVGGNGTPTGQLYVSGSVPTAAVSTIATGTGSTPYSVYVQGRYAYVADYGTNALGIYDVSNPASPVLLGSVTTGTNPSDVYVEGRYAYVTNLTSNTLQIIDISNPTSPVVVGSVSTGSGSGAIAVYVEGRYAYVANLNGPYLQVIDISNPSNPVVVGSVATGNQPDAVYVQGRYAYVVNITAATLQVIDISNPTSPVVVGSVATGTDPYAFYVQGRYAYVANNGSNNLQVIDISNPTSPVTVGTMSTGAGSGPDAVYVDGRYAYVANNGGSTLQTIDVSNPSNPVSVGTVPTSTGPNSVYVSGRYAYVANQGSTLQIFDLGGEYAQQLEAGGAEVGTLQVDTDANVAGDASIQGGLNVGAGLQVAGQVGVNGSLNLTANALSSPSSPTLANSASSATICGGNYLTNATTYYYEIAAVSGNSITNAVAATPASVTTGTSTCDTLTWTAVTGATGYIVYESTNGTTWYSNGVNSSTLGIVDNGTTYAWTNAVSPLTNTNNGGDLTVQGDSLFENVANSTTAFQIQNSTGVTLLDADTTNSRIVIGAGSTGEANPTILELDSKNTSGDATGVNGAIYYNTGGNGGANNGSGVGSLAGVFRCYQGGVWQDCIGMRNIVERRYGFAIPNNTAATTFTLNGEYSCGGSSAAGTSSGQAESNYILFATSGVSGNANGINSGAVNDGCGAAGPSFTTTEQRWLPKLVTRIRVDPANATTSNRYWVALTSAALTAVEPEVASTATTATFAGVGATTTNVAGGLTTDHWACDAGNASHYAGVDMGVAVTSGHYYDIILDWSNSGTLVCSISDNGGAFVSVATTTDVVTGNATPLGVSETVTTQTTAARDLSVAYSYLETN